MLKSWNVHRKVMRDFDTLLADLIEEPPEVMGTLADVVNRGRLQADDLEPDLLETLSGYELITFLIQRHVRQPVRTWVYPTPLGLRLFALLEREAEREVARERAQALGGRRNQA